MKERIEWIDVAKFLGIFAIYLGHFGAVAGHAYHFVFKYHVELFFFLSGCMSFYDKESNLLNYCVKKFKSIMLPFWGFCILSLVFSTLIGTIGGFSGLIEMIIAMLKGNIRNTFIAGSLWFLTCLFVMEIIFKLIKYVKNKFLIFGICLSMYFIAEKIITPRPIVEPHWLYNLDSVFYYIIFFAIGYITYPHIINLFKLDTKIKKIIFSISGIIGLAYAATVFFGLYISFGFFTHIIRALLLIWANLVVAKLFERIRIFSEIGRNTLFLCGNEYLTRYLIPGSLKMIGLSQYIPTALAAYIWVFIYLIFGIKLLIPLEKKFVNIAKDFLFVPTPKIQS